RHQAARGAVRHVAELADGSLDGSPRDIADAAVTIDDPRDRGPGDVRQPSDLLERHVARRLSPHLCESALTIICASYDPLSRERSHARVRPPHWVGDRSATSSDVSRGAAVGASMPSRPPTASEPVAASPCLTTLPFTPAGSPASTRRSPRR